MKTTLLPRPCRTCDGTGKVLAKSAKGARPVPCPACNGTKVAGLRTKAAT